MSEKFSCDISSELIDLGIKCEFLVIRNLKNKESDPEFEALKEQELELISRNLTPEDPILQGFREIHKDIGCANRKNIPAPENLLKFFTKAGQLPHVNLLVDIYNLVSIKTHLALGAHDLNYISGNVHLRLTDGSENFLPLGAPEPKAVKSGEYAYVDDSNDIICRLEVRQVEKTKVMLDTDDCLYIIQGNKATSKEYIASAAQELTELTTRFCGGEPEVIYQP